MITVFAILVSIILTVGTMWLHGSYMIEKGYLKSWRSFWDDKLMGIFLLILGTSGAAAVIGLLKSILKGIGWLVGA